MKPVAAARGQGIKIITKSTTVHQNKNYLIMDYIANPHLIQGIKYDLRVYVLVTSFNPLRIYIYEEGLTRFATQEYSIKTKEKFVHLTNFSINKYA